MSCSLWLFFSSWETQEYHSVYLTYSYSISSKNTTQHYKSLQTSIITRGIRKMICIAMLEHSRLLEYVNRSQLTITNYQLLTVAAVWLDLSSFTLSYGHENTELVFVGICIIKKEPATNLEMFPDSDLRNIENSLVIIAFQSFIFFPFSVGPLGCEIILWHFAGSVITGRYQSCHSQNVYHTPLVGFDV